MSEKEYSITETSDSFTITRSDRNPVTVTLLPTCLQVSYLEPLSWVGDAGNQQVERRFNPYSYYNMTAETAEGLLAFWKRPEEYQAEAERFGHPMTYRPEWLDKWLTKLTAATIGKQVHRQWQRLLDKMPPDVLAASRKMFVTEFRRATYLNEAFLANRFAIKDIATYRAAAMAAAMTPELFEAYIVRKYGQTLNYRYSRIIGYSAVSKNWDLWPALFSNTGEIYGSLTKTLMNLPGHIPPQSIGYLSQVHLERPITNRLELLALLLMGRYHEHRLHEHIFQHATAGQIKTAMKLFGDYAHVKLVPNKNNDVRRFVGFLGDYREEHTGNLIGLTEKAIKWHRSGQEEIRQQNIQKYGETYALPTPPIPLPDLPQVRFLSTVGDICQESETMEHCVADYIERAIMGECYLFHIERNGEAATVEVYPSGKVAQSQGPRNSENSAAKWGQRTLSRWGKTLREQPPIVREIHPRIVDRIDDPFFEGIDLEALLLQQPPQPEEEIPF